MEVLKDGRFNLIETDNLIVKKMNSYTLKVDTILTELSSGSLYLLDSINNNITIILPPIKSGINYEFIFNNTSKNSITFKTSETPLDNSKFIGTDWLYLKRTDINIDYSSLVGSTLTFKKTQKGEYIKFYSDGNNYYIIEKNDTNNNINNIITSYPSNTNFNYIVNINKTTNGYQYNIINEQTNVPIEDILMNTTYNFKFNTLTNEYNSITNITSTLLYDLHVYIGYYDQLTYNFDDPTSTKKYKYNYPVFNFALKDALNNKFTELDLFNTTYRLNLNNNSILYPSYLYTSNINTDKDENANVLSKTSVLNIDYNIVEDNLVIFNEFNSVIYDHNNNRSFLLANRDIDYTINYLNTSFTIALSNTNVVIYNGISKFKFTSSTGEQPTFIVKNIDKIDTHEENNKLYFLYFKCTVNSQEKTFKIPLLLLDQLLIQPQNNSYITIKNKIYNQLPKIDGIVNYNYEFDIISNDLITTLDNLDFSFLNTKQSASTIEENIFTLMKSKLRLNVKQANIDDYLLKFMTTGVSTEYYNTNFSMQESYKVVSLYIDYKTTHGINISYYSNFNNITGGSFKLNQFIVDDSYSGKLIMLNLKQDITLNLKNNIEGNFYEFIVDNDNISDNNIYTLIKQKNNLSVDEYYFIKNSDTSTLLKTIDLYTSNKYEIILDNSISTFEILRNNTSKLNDLIQFSSIKDGLINFKKTQNYNFITKKINDDNTLSLVIDLIDNETPNTLYLYNKNIRNMGSSINILSVDNRLNNVYINSLYPFTSEYKYYINNISYEKTSLDGVDNYVLSLKKMKKGDSLKLYFNNNVNIVREFKFSDNDDNIIKYPDNIISNNNLTLQFIENSDTNNYDITLYDTKLNAINNTNTTFKFIKNQLYTIEQKHNSNYNLENNNTTKYYLQLKYKNSKLIYNYYTDSRFFSNPLENIQLYRGLQYRFNQSHRSNYNPDIDIDLNRVFKVTVEKNANGISSLYINNMEKYIPKLLVKTIYYFDISNVIPYKFRFSLYEDGLFNNVFSEYKTSEVTYKDNVNNDIHLIKLELEELNPNTILYYYSETFRNIGSYLNIVKSSINYLLTIKETKKESKSTVNEYFVNKNIPSYEVLFKDNVTQEEKKQVLFYKDNQIQFLKFKLNFDESITNKLYTSTLSNIVAADTIVIYVNEIYNELYPKLSYFEFYSDINLISSSKISLPLTILRNKKYKFKQVNFKESVFKFFICLNECPLNYAEDINNTSKYDNNILTYVPDEGFVLNTTNLMNSFIYYSGIHYSLPDMYSGSEIISLVNNDKLLLNYKMLLIIEKDIYLSDNYDNVDERINITETLTTNYYELTQEDISLKHLFNIDKSNFYLKNKNHTIDKNVTFNISSNNFVISYINNPQIFVSTISTSKYSNYNSPYNRTINLLSNVQFLFDFKEDGNNTVFYKIKYSNDGLKDLDIIKSTESNVSYDYILYKVNETNFDYTNTTNESLVDNTKTIFTLNNFRENTTIMDSSSNYYNIYYRPDLITTFEDNKFKVGVYEYFISIKPSITSFDIVFNSDTNTNDLYTLISLNPNNSISNTTNTLNIIPSTDDIQYINIVLRENATNNVYIYTLKIIRESNDKIVNFGKLIINDLDHTNSKITQTYLSKSIQYNLGNIDNILPNSDLLNTYILELVDTQFDSGESVKTITNKKFTINTDTFSNLKSTDIISDKNIVASNLYISDFRTIILDISNNSLLGENIQFYTDINANNILENNIIYSGKCGETNSKILLNINPNINSILYYYSDCLYESKFKYNMKIDVNSNKEFYIDSDVSNENKTYLYNIYDIDIIPFLENTDDFYYNITVTKKYINLDGSQFILYNNNNTYKGTIICRKAKIVNETISYGYNIYLQFDDTFKLYDSINITTDYTLKIFNFVGGSIFTPNYLYFDKINTKTEIDVGNNNENIKTNNNIFNTTQTYLVNNKVIDSDFYLGFNSTNSEKYQIAQNSYEKFRLIDDHIHNNSISLTNTNIKYDTNAIYSISNTDTDKNIAKKMTTRLNNPTNYVNVSNSTVVQTNTANNFDILVKLMRTVKIGGFQYYSIKLNINSFDGAILILKPYHSYTFSVNKSFILKDIDNQYYNISSPKLSIVNIDDTKTLSTIDNSIEDTITVNIPYESDLYETTNKLYIKVECEIVLENNSIKLAQGYYNRSNNGDAYRSSTNMFVDYIPILVDRKSVINNTIEFKNNAYYINNHINKLNVYNYFTHIFDISQVPTFDINLIDSESNLITDIYKSVSTNKILLYTTKITNEDYTLDTNKNDIFVYLNESELSNISVNNDSKYIIFLNNKYTGNDSSNDYENNVQKSYKLKYVGEPGYNGELIYNLNGVLDFNVNTYNISQNLLYVNNNVYFNHIKDMYNFNVNLFNTSSILLYEPIKLVLKYKINNTNNYVDLPNYSYSTNYFPGKPDSKLTIQIPKDIDDDNIFNENIRLTTVGLYSNAPISNISDFDIISDIFTLPQHNSTIFLDITNNTIIKLPIPNYSLEYKFIIVNSAIDPKTGKSFITTFTTNNYIYGYIDESLNKNVELRYNKELIFNNIVKGNSFILTSNKENYYLENISIERSVNEVSTINFNNTIIYIPNKTNNIIDVDADEEQFILKNSQQLLSNILYKDKLYTFNTDNLSTDYFNLIQLDPLNIKVIDTSNGAYLNEYTNLYYILSIDKITTNNIAFDSFISDKNIQIYDITYNNANNTLLFNNSETIPTLYSNYIYEFYKPSGLYILNNYNLSLINKSPNIIETDYVTISNDVLNAKLRINNKIRHSVPSTSIKITPASNGTEDNMIQIIGDNFKNISMDTEIYFDEDLYYSISPESQTIPKVWTKLFSRNTIYKPIMPGDSEGRIRFIGVTFENNPLATINNSTSGYGGTEITTVKANTYLDSINFNRHKLMYIYYYPVEINSLNNSLIIEETNALGIISVTTFTLLSDKYNSYNYSILGADLSIDLVEILNNELSAYNYLLTIENDRYKLVHLLNNFKIIETNLSKLLGFNVTPSVNKTIYAVIPNTNNVFPTDEFYNYYGNKLLLDTNRLHSDESNSTISINLVEDKHIELPQIVEGLTYTFIINDALVDKKLIIHSSNPIYYINNSTNTNGNILILKPNLGNKLYTGTSITISCNNDKYFIIDTKGFEYTINLYTTKIYNSNNNFSNLYFTENGISYIDKYISIYGIHLVGLRDSNNTSINEKKFLHVAKTLAKLLDYNETKSIYDDNILNSIVHKNTYILLYTNSIPNNTFLDNKHHNNIFLKYKHINTEYDYTTHISQTNKYDRTLESMINLLINSYIHTYPHIFRYSELKGNTSLLSVYEYVDSAPITFDYSNNLANRIYIEDTRNVKTEININDKYFNSSTISNINYSVGSNLTVRINKLTITYFDNKVTNLSGTITIINIGIGYKNNDVAKIKIAENVFVVIKLKTKDISSTSNLYNIYNAYNQVTNSSLDTFVINELINNTEDNINTSQSGLITSDNVNNFTKYSIELGEKLYTKSMISNDDIVTYTTSLLLGLLGYYKYRNCVGKVLTEIDFNLITPTLIKKYNSIFVNIYFTTSLYNINTLSNIHSYNLDNIGYNKSTDSELNDLQLIISDTNVTSNYNPLVTDYSNIIFNNTLLLNLISNNQYSTFNTIANKITNNVSTSLPIIDETTNKPIVDISSIKFDNYYDTDVKVIVEVSSESGNKTNYTLDLERTIDKTSNINIENVSVLANNELISSTNNVVDNRFIYYKENTNNVIKIILKNIYSNILSFTINSLNKVNTNTSNNYNYDYLFTPQYYQNDISITVTGESHTVGVPVTSSYNMILHKLQNKITTLDDVIITNVSNIANFNKYDNYYSGELSNDVFNNLSKNIISNTDNTNNISLHIKKTDKYSAVHTTIEYLDSDNNYIVFREYNTDFINNIFTFNKNGDDYKDIILNKNHRFKMNYPIEKWNNTDKGFQLDILGSNISEDLDNPSNNDNVLDKTLVKIKNISSDTDDSWANNSILNTTFDINTNYYVGFHATNQQIITLRASGPDSNPDITIDTTDDISLLNRAQLTIESLPFKNISGDLNTEVLNISDISRIRINIIVFAENKIDKNEYTYIIKLK